MKLSEVMTKDVLTLRPDSPINEVARVMKELNVGAIPICDGNRLVGMITDRDLAVRVIAEDADPKSKQVKDVMSPGIHWCYEDDDVTAAVSRMQELQIRRLAVVSRDKQLVGIVSLGDIAAKSGDVKLTGEALKQVSEPAKPAA